MLIERTVEGLTLKEIAVNHGLGTERIRQLLNYYFRVTGVPDAVKIRRAKNRELRIQARLEG
jgi:DNA-binding CsgD family transcriptional regulator